MQRAYPVFTPPNGQVLDLEATFNRNHFCKNFGAGPNVPYAGWPPSAREKHLPAGVGHDRLIVLDDDWNPYRPLYPCAPGLVFSFPGTDMFASRKSAKRVIDPLYTVISEISSVKKVKTWRYCGEYRLLDLGDKTLGTTLTKQARILIPQYSSTVGNVS